jgi:Holliday junction resolvasome RuvABC endonuclease subunit
MRIIGLDPGTGSSSPAGFVDFDSETGVIYDFLTISSKERNANDRIRDIAAKISKRVTSEHDLITVETFYLRGKGGQTLQRFIGAAIYGTAPVPLQEVYNTTVKRLVGGAGNADKRDVAYGVLDWFTAKNDDSAEGIKRLIYEERFDELDAFAIGIAGYELFTGGAE